MEIEDEESLKKENITITDSSKDFDNNITKLEQLKNKIEYEIGEIDKEYDKANKDIIKSYEIKTKKLNTEENE